MAEDDDDSQKTEQPTQKRLDDAREKGNIPFSREVGSFFMLMALAVTVAAFGPGMLHQSKLLLMPFIVDADSMPTDEKGLAAVMSRVTFAGAGIIAAPLIATLIAALAGGFIQTGVLFSLDHITPKLEKISPLAGIKRMFSMRSVVELLKGIVKIGIVGAIAFMQVWPELPHIRQLPDTSMEAMLVFLLKMATHMVIAVCVAMFFIALADVMYQRFQFRKNLRMTKQEIRDEYKQSEGDPMIKQRLRRLRMERARKRMISAVPKADVVITNPTHFAVALSYDQARMKAPMLVAKGQDLIALRIREIAEKNNVPVIENPPLARALFSSTEVDAEVPYAHYEAVAKIISYVYQLKGKRFGK